MTRLRPWCVMKQTFLLIAFIIAAMLALTATVCAEDITASAVLSPAYSALTDGRESTCEVMDSGAVIKISSPTPIAGVYIKFDRTPPQWHMRAGNAEILCGRYGFLHEWCDLTSLQAQGGDIFDIELVFDGGAVEICDIYVFSAGELPDWVQCWQPAEGDADLMLMTTHADDEQLFFLGVLPYYAGELQYSTQVVYFTNHNNTRNRPHELLNGLWTVGVRRYPVIGGLPDYWDGYNETLDYSYAAALAEGFTRDDLVAFQVAMLRRYRPQVVVGHDIDGEYGHPQHKINTDTLISALTLAADPSYLLPDSALAAWDVPKTYLHLYRENRITMDWDRPLSRFGGMTAYEVSKLGYACHLSQQYTWFTAWMHGKDREYTKATEITTYKPTDYGLYRSLVGADRIGGDFFENLAVRSQQTSDTAVTETVALPQNGAETSVCLPPDTSELTIPADITTDSTAQPTEITSMDAETSGASGEVLGSPAVAIVLTAIVLVVILTTMYIGFVSSKNNHKK